MVSKNPSQLRILDDDHCVLRLCGPYYFLSIFLLCSWHNMYRLYEQIGKTFSPRTMHIVVNKKQLQGINSAKDGGHMCKSL